MVDPVIASDGFSYERKEFEKWLQANKASPITNEPFSEQEDPVPNRNNK